MPIMLQDAACLPYQSCSRSSRHHGSRRSSESNSAGGITTSPSLRNANAPRDVSFASERDQPENGGERAGHRQIRTEIDANQSCGSGMGRNLRDLSGGRRDKPIPAGYSPGSTRRRRRCRRIQDVSCGESVDACFKTPASAGSTPVRLRPSTRMNKPATSGSTDQAKCPSTPR